MPYDPKEALCLSKLTEWKYMADDGVVCEGPCFILDVSTKVGAAAGVAIVYDGLNASADIFLHTGGGANQTQQKSYDCPPYLKNGIYVALDVNITSMTLHFIREAMLK
jgi:hypothetical protein